MNKNWIFAPKNTKGWSKEKEGFFFVEKYTGIITFILLEWHRCNIPKSLSRVHDLGFFIQKFQRNRFAEQY